MKTVTIVSEDRVGLLADISYILGKSSVNIEGIVAEVVGGKAIISLEVKDPKRTSEILSQNNFKTADPDAIVVKVPANGMDQITEMLAGEKVLVMGMSSLSSDASEGIFAINVDKPRKACRMLSTFLLANAAPI